MRAIGNDSVSRLLEEERRIAFVGFLHLTDMIDVIAADAINPAHWKPATTCERQLGRL
jgi:hypothetical protein